MKKIKLLLVMLVVSAILLTGCTGTSKEDISKCTVHCKKSNMDFAQISEHPTGKLDTCYCKFYYNGSEEKPPTKPTRW